MSRRRCGALNLGSRRHGRRAGVGAKDGAVAGGPRLSSGCVASAPYQRAVLGQVRASHLYFQASAGRYPWAAPDRVRARLALVGRLVQLG